MQIVDVLRHKRKGLAALGERILQARQREMRRVGLGVAQVPTTQIVERQHRLGIASEGFGRRQLHRVELRPDSLASLVAKRAQPALGGDPGAGEDEDVLRHALPPVQREGDLHQGGDEFEHDQDHDRRFEPRRAVGVDDVG